MQADYPKYIDAKMSMFVRKPFVFHVYKVHSRKFYMPGY